MLLGRPIWSVKTAIRGCPIVILVVSKQASDQVWVRGLTRAAFFHGGTVVRGCSHSLSRIADGESEEDSRNFGNKFKRARTPVEQCRDNWTAGWEPNRGFWVVHGDQAEIVYWPSGEE